MIMLRKKETSWEEENGNNKGGEIFQKSKSNASVGNRTRANCLEGNYDTISPRKPDDTGNHNSNYISQHKAVDLCGRNTDYLHFAVWCQR
jgi:hypothetical protein